MDGGCKMINPREFSCGTFTINFVHENEFAENGNLSVKIPAYSYYPNDNKPKSQKEFIAKLLAAYDVKT